MKNEYQEKSTIVCPQCETKMELIIEEDKKIGKCKQCNYVEPNYNN